MNGENDGDGVGRPRPDLHGVRDGGFGELDLATESLAHGAAQPGPAQFQGDEVGLRERGFVAVGWIRFADGEEAGIGG